VDANHGLNHDSCSQDRLHIGYVTLSTTLLWFYRKGSAMEYDEYIHMLKMVGFTYVSNWFCVDKPFCYSFGKEPTALEVTIPRSSRFLLSIGLIGNSSQIPQLTPTTNIPMGSPTMRVAGCSALPNWIGTTQCK